jgi:predicted RNase H-like HicB family nuclease
MPDVLERNEVVPEFLADVVRCPACHDPLISVPVLKCAHCGASRALRAFYYKVPEGYIAECIDLNLMSQGSTPEEAIKRLQEAMYGYLQVAFEGESTRGLVLRLSPLSHRLRYYWHKMLSRLGSERHQHLMRPHDSSDTQKLCHC